MAMQYLQTRSSYHPQRYRRAMRDYSQSRSRCATLKATWVIASVVQTRLGRINATWSYVNWKPIMRAASKRLPCLKTIFKGASGTVNIYTNTSSSHVLCVPDILICSALGAASSFADVSSSKLAFSSRSSAFVCYSVGITTGSAFHCLFRPLLPALERPSPDVRTVCRLPALPLFLSPAPFLALGPSLSLPSRCPF